MPTLGASLAATLAAWTLDAAVSSFLGVPARLFLNLLVSVVVFYYARRFLNDLRGQ